MSQTLSAELKEVEQPRQELNDGARGNDEPRRALRKEALDQRLAGQTDLATRRGEHIRQLANELLSAEQRERSRLAADLHELVQR